MVSVASEEHVSMVDNGRDDGSDGEVILSFVFGLNMINKSVHRLK